MDFYISVIHFKNNFHKQFSHTINEMYASSVVKGLISFVVLTSPNDAMAESSANEVVDAGFTSQYELQP